MEGERTRLYEPGNAVLMPKTGFVDKDEDATGPRINKPCARRRGLSDLRRSPITSHEEPCECQSEPYSSVYAFHP